MVVTVEMAVTVVDVKVVAGVMNVTDEMAVTVDTALTVLSDDSCMIVIVKTAVTVVKGVTLRWL